MKNTLSIVLMASASLLPLPVFAQASRIVGKIDNSQRIVLHGHLSPKALPEDDQGPVDSSMQLSPVTLMLQPSTEQQAALEKLLAEQQDPSSPNYHKWLTPEQFAAQFGASQPDINTIVQWLQSQNLKVLSVARARNSISVSGTAGAIENAFQVEIHRFVINGQTHFANATEPSVPAAFDSVVSGIRGLNDFRLRPASRIRRIVPQALRPQDNSGLCGGECIAPADFATIYDLTPLYNSGLNGSGQSLVVVGQTDIRTSDITDFRSAFNLPTINLQQILVPGSQDPGFSPGDLSESDLDIELSGATAPSANIIFVYAEDVETSLDYAIDQNLAPVISMSYGDCEYAYTSQDLSSMQQMAQQANSEGITWLAASGDNGALDCYGDPIPQADEVSVDVPAAIPEVTGIGGSEFTGDSPGPPYWSTTNAANGGSALSYIPETAWNDTAEDAGTCSTPVCPAATGGGVSIYFSKPSWQTGSGVPSDGMRDVPDLAISASANHDGYIIYTSDGCQEGRAVTTCEEAVGGTSVGPPHFSGLMMLLDQKLTSSGVGSRLGNINPEIYSLASSNPSVYHDITTGNNIIDINCPPDTRLCTPASGGYSAGPGYDQVTGWGSFDANALLTAWAANLSSSSSTTTSAPPVVGGIANGASFDHTYAPGMVLSIFGTALAPSTQTASAVPLPFNMAGVTVTVGGYNAPLYYVSSEQINIQVPYEVAPGSTVQLTVDNNGQTSSMSFPVAAAAPGIFVDSTGAPVAFGSASLGQTTTLFITGAGAVSPAVQDGAAPPTNITPIPTQTVTMTIGGVPVSTSYEYLGIPSGLVGVVQINYTVPSNAPLGSQPIVVTVGGVASVAATLTVTQ